MAKKRSVTPNGKAIREARLKKKWSVEDLAEAAGYKPKTIKTAESGTPVEENTLIAIASALNVAYDEVESKQPAVQITSVVAAGIAPAAEKDMEVRAVTEYTTRFAKGIPPRQAIEQIISRVMAAGIAEGLIRITVTRGLDEN